MTRKVMEWEEEKVEDLKGDTVSGVERSVLGEGTEEARGHGLGSRGQGEERGTVAGVGGGSAKEGALEEKVRRGVGRVSRR